MKPQLILHIGRQKTGTSALQRTLAQASDQLGAVGILYPTSGRGSRVAHHQLAHVAQMAGSPEWLALRERLEDESRDFDTLIVSSEGLQNIRSPESVVGLFAFCRSIHVVAYLREAAEHVVSSYAQKIHQTPAKVRFVDWANGVQFDYANFINKWKSVSDCTTVRLFAKEHLVDGDITSDFLVAVGIGWRLPDGIQRVHTNPNIGGNLLFTKLLMNLSGVTDGLDRNYVTRELARIASTAIRFRSGFSVPESLISDIRLKHSLNNSWLENRFGKLRLASFSMNPAFPDWTTFWDDLDGMSSFLRPHEISRLRSIAREECDGDDRFGGIPSPR